MPDARIPTRKAEALRPTSVLATLTGRDRPGVTASFFAALSAHDVDVRDVEQVVVRDRLVLSVYVDLRGDPAALRSSATRTAQALGMECEVTVADETGRAVRPPALGAQTHVLVIGPFLRAGAVGHVAQRIAGLGANIDSIAQQSVEPLSTIELLVRSTDSERLHAALVQAAQDTGVDIAAQSARIVRLPKRLAVCAPSVPVDEIVRVAAVGERLGVRVARLGEDGLPDAAAVPGFAASLGVGRDQLIAVGTGPADQELLTRAGLAVTCGARSGDPGRPSANAVLVALGVTEAVG